MANGKMISKPKSFPISRNIMTMKAACIIALNCFGFVLVCKHLAPKPPPPNRRTLSIDKGNGLCVWEEAVPMGRDVKSFGTLITSYPASGMRFTWQQAEGLTGIQVGDDFMLGGDGVDDKTGLLKTQYPHLEGIWSWGENMNQAILLVRNPRWAIPSYHTLLYEIHYAHDWETAYRYLGRTFSMRPPLLQWEKWRDYRFKEEIKLWRWHIDFWMEGGTKYWIDYDYERCGQWPFFYLDEADRSNWPRDEHCSVHMDCNAKVVLSYEKLRDASTGPGELRKIANAVRDKEGFDMVLGDAAIECIWAETNVNKKVPANEHRDEYDGPSREDFTFTIDQLEVILENIQLMIDKYSSGVWVDNPLAQDLVESFNSYKNGVALELNTLIANPPPTQAPNADRHQELVYWYNSLGRGNRYDKEKIQAMHSFWPKVKHVFENAGENPYH